MIYIGVRLQFMKHTLTYPLIDINGRKGMKFQEFKEQEEQKPESPFPLQVLYHVL